MKYHIYIKTNFQYESFLEQVEDFKLEKNGDLKLYAKGKFWLFPASVIQLLIITEIEKKGENNGNDI